MILLGLEPKETEPMAYLQTNVVYSNKKRTHAVRYHELKTLLVPWKQTCTSRTKIIVGVSNGIRISEIFFNTSRPV